MSMPAVANDFPVVTGLHCSVWAAEFDETGDNTVLVQEVSYSVAQHAPEHIIPGSKEHENAQCFPPARG
jgi:hypothetical protein